MLFHTAKNAENKIWTKELDLDLILHQILMIPFLEIGSRFHLKTDLDGK